MKILTVAFLALGVGGMTVSGCAPAASNNGSTKNARGSSAAPTSFATLPKVGMRATCLVMGRAFTIKKGTQYAKHHGRYYVFCCAGCRPKFLADPHKYVKH